MKTTITAESKLKYLSCPDFYENLVFFTNHGGYVCFIFLF